MRKNSINYALNSTEEYTFNDEGFLTSFVSNYAEEIQFRFVLDTGGSVATVPFGNYFLILMVISVKALVSFEKHKIK
ncbi:MAG: hypothetical protein ACFFAI_11525 [Promethearchaeota archaeon]